MTTPTEQNILKKKEVEYYLFVWHNVLAEYTSGMAFCIAQDLEEALAFLNKKAGYSLELPIDKMTKHKLSNIKKPVGEYIYGGG